jgi:hypothetical protein
LTIPGSLFDWSKEWANGRMQYINIGFMAVVYAGVQKEIEIEDIEVELNPANNLTKEDGIAEKFLSLC